VSPAEPQGHDFAAGHEQIAVLVVPAVMAQLVPDATVELDDEPEAFVRDVPVDHPVLGPLGPLPVRTRKAMGALDPAAVPALEHRLDTVGRLVESLKEPTAACHGGTSVQLVGDPGRGGDPPSAGVSQHSERVDAGGGLGAAGQEGVLHPHAWRPHVPLHPLLEAHQPVDPDPQQLGGGARLVDGDMDDITGAVDH
jgi:hypothetical protein